jgi:aryl-alcohol dehydrogenase-like predicted oxidoreductase
MGPVMPRLGHGALDVFGLCLGGNVFGWTADEQASFAVLDAYVAASGNFVDTADQYSAFAAGNVGGESETIIGRWMHARANRADVVLATKVGRKPGREGLAPDNIRAGIEESLRRLQTDYVDLYYAHRDDPDTPLEETLGAFDALVREGKVRHIAASNYEAPRLAQALAVSDREGLARYVALQTHYNLVERERYEGPLRDLCAREELACLPYWALARGFLTGKYRPGGDVVDSPRAGQASAYLDDRGLRVLDALDAVAAAHDATPAAVAIAWLRAQPTVATPIASARNVDQLESLLAGAELVLSDAELARLRDAGA